MTKILRRPLILWNAARHGDKPYAASIIYRTDDPFAVTILFPTHRGSDVQEFVLGRALLIDGLEAPAGEGVVRVEPHIIDQDYISITLPTTSDGVEFYTSRAGLESFVDATLRRVPLGGELAPAASALDRWLAGVTA